MSSTLTISTITNVSTSETALNANFTAIEAALAGVVCRKESSTMEAAIDFNSNRIRNLPYAASNYEPVVLKQVNELIASVVPGASSEILWGSLTGVTTPASADRVLFYDASEPEADAEKSATVAQLIEHTGDITCGADGVTTIGTGKVVEANYAATSIPAAALKTGAVETAKIVDANVTAVKLATDAVETAKINDAAVTVAKLENIPVGSFIGRTTAGTGVPEQVRVSEFPSRSTLVSGDKFLIETTAGATSYVDFDNLAVTGTSTGYTGVDTESASTVVLTATSIGKVVRLTGSGAQLIHFTASAFSAGDVVTLIWDGASVSSVEIPTGALSATVVSPETNFIEKRYAQVTATFLVGGATPTIALSGQLELS